METIQIVLDRQLLDSTDKAARRLKQNRSALVRTALHDYLSRLEIRMKEERERAGYERIPEDVAEARIWESEAMWPAE